MLPSRNIILIGPMGAGKTTIGRKLAQSLKMSFIDVDEEIERQLGVDIQTIFDTEGEKGFRERENKVFQFILHNYRSSIIATGGGCVLLEENRKIMQAERLVVHIDVCLETQYHRLQSDKRRPILQVKNLRQTLQNLRLERHDIYQSVADFCIESNNSNIWSTVQLIEKKLETTDCCI